MVDYLRYLRLPLMDIKPHHFEGGVPVFTPSMAEFEDFYHFQRSINAFGMQSGVVKVIPPAEWTAALEYTPELYDSVRIRNPIVQQINVVQAGVFAQRNVERQRSYTLSQWKTLSEQPNHQPPKVSLRGSTSEATPTDASSGEAQPGPSLQLPRVPTTTGLSVQPSRARASRVVPAATKYHHRAHSLPSPQEASLSPHHIDVAQFTADRCASLEKTYWRTLNYAEPMYGADTLGSIFPPTVKSWNVSLLPNVLSLLPERLPGVNDAYLYAGLWKATFAWHLEDQDLYSINYIHLGAPKQWYAIPQRARDRFFAVMTDLYPDEHRACPDFLRHKTFLVSPKYLEAHGVEVNRIVHRQGEFMITYPHGYHCGFNYGYNLAESVNFALDYWFEVAKDATKCECIDDAVGINVEQIRCFYKHEPYVPVVVADLPDTTAPLLPEPPLKMISKAGVDAVVKVPKVSKECLLCPNSTPKLLRKLHPFNLLEVEGRRGKVHRLCAEMCHELLIQVGGSVTDSAEVVPSIALPIAVEMPGPVVEPPGCHPPLVPILVKPKKTKPAPDVVVNYPDIPLSRKNLRCLVCHLAGASHGVCFQCDHSKCTRAYHATCALGAGVFFDLDTTIERANLCKLHRSKQSEMAKTNFEDTSILADSEAMCSSLTKSSVIQFTLQGNSFSGVVMRNNQSEGTVEVLVYPKLNEALEIAYERVLPNAKQWIAEQESPVRSVKGLRVPKKALDNREWLCSGVKDPSLCHSVSPWGASSLILEVVTLSSVDSAYRDGPCDEAGSVWVYLPAKSTDQIARFTDDPLLLLPNDPSYRRSLEKKALSRLKEGLSTRPPKKPKVEANTTPILGAGTLELCKRKVLMKLLAKLLVKHKPGDVTYILPFYAPPSSLSSSTLTYPVDRGFIPNPQREYLPPFPTEAYPLGYGVQGYAPASAPVSAPASVSTSVSAPASASATSRVSPPIETCPGGPEMLLSQGTFQCPLQDAFGVPKLQAYSGTGPGMAPVMIPRHWSVPPHHPPLPHLPVSFDRGVPRAPTLPPVRPHGLSHPQSTLCELPLWGPV